MNKTLQNVLVVVFLLSVSISSTTAQDDIATVKTRIIAEIMQPVVDDARITQLVSSIQEDGTWPGIDYIDVSRTAFEHRYHLSNMVDLARAYKTTESGYYKSKKVKKAIESALNNWVNNDYICENWWHNQIGTPGNLVTLLLIIGEELDRELVEKTQPIIQRAHVDAPGARPGGDRIKIAGIQAKNMLFLGDRETFGTVIKVIENEIKYVKWIGMDYGYTFRNVTGGFSNRSDGGRGIQYDNSFHHRTDGVNNTLSYGRGYAHAFIEWAVYVANTKYSFSAYKIQHLIDYYIDGICKTAVFGKYPDFAAKNRSISRQGALRPYNASPVEKLMLTSSYRKDELQEIADIRNKGAKPTLSHATFYWHSEHFTFQRPGFFTSVRMYSIRNHNMEQPYNSEGLLNHHRGDGTNHISIAGDEYDDIAPVFDYQKVPGATIMQKPKMPSHEKIQKLGYTGFVGAATDGTYAAVGFDFRSPHDPLIARKSWFFFDEGYVCLGTGISCKSELPVVTTLNQCLLRDDVIISSGNMKKVIQKGENKFKNIHWIFQDGIGYVFPQPTDVNIKNNKATGSWWRINKQTNSPKEKIALDVFKIWVDHGERPSDETYEYLVFPATTVENLEQHISKNNMVILSNTPEVQAVKHEDLNMLQAVFYASEKVTVTDDILLTCHTPAIILLKMDGGKITKITVADPNRELGHMNLSVSLKIEKEGKNFRAIWDEGKQVTEMSIDLPKGVYAGKSISIEL